MITISVNNESLNLNKELLLSDFLVAKKGDSENTPPFAIALNGDFVSRSQYSSTLLKNGDNLDIVSPVGGG